MLIFKFLGFPPSKAPDVLKQTLFFRFMEDLQAEVQEMEFLQFSKGMDTMRREDFAEWLLHYTNEEDNEVYWENMRKKIPAGQVKSFNSNDDDNKCCESISQCRITRK